MRRLREMGCLAALLFVAASALAQPRAEWFIQSYNRLTQQPSLDAGVIYDFATKTVIATNGVLVRYGEAVMTAEKVAVDQETGWATAEGEVRIQQGDQLWASERVRYNFKTQQIEAGHYRTGQAPMFAAGEDLRAEITNRIYISTNSIITAEDISEPFLKVRAREIRIIPGEKIVAKHAVLYAGQVPVFYFPYYSRNLGPHASNFSATPGYRSAYGPFLLGSYNWYINEYLEVIAHLDYRERRGVGLGPDFNYQLGRWGSGTLRYYYTHDDDPQSGFPDVPIQADRQRLYFSYLSAPATNLEARALVRYESDLAIVRDFFEGEYRRDPQPSTYFDLNQFWSNFSLDLYAQPRINPWLETVERLPEIRLTGFRQQLGESPLYYESQSAAGWYRRRFAEGAGTNGPLPGLDYSAARADSFHQLLLPHTFFGWLNFIPRAGGRFTYYGEASGPGAFTDEVYRGVFNTGAELNFKASRVWPDAEMKFFDIHGVRHIVEPSINYVYVPAPNESDAGLIPRFDFDRPSLRLLPIDFPDSYAIDSIDTENVIRWGLRNRLQTKREDGTVNLASWDVYTDWRLKPRRDQTTFADLYSDAQMHPWRWLAVESLLRYDLGGGRIRMSFNTLTFQPGNTWSWGLGHFYLRDDLRASPTALGIGNNLFTSTAFYRLNENWGFRASHHFEARDGRLEEQLYTVYRDLRSWTAALTFLVRDNRLGGMDYTVALTFSLKAVPKFGLGADTARPYTLLGGS